MIQTAVLHGSGYVGRELIRLLLQHPKASLNSVTSRTYSNSPLYVAHPSLRDQQNIQFTSVTEFEFSGIDVIFVAAEHGKGAASVRTLIENGYPGCIIDMSSDFRFTDVSQFESLFKVDHPAPELITEFSYGQPELFAPYSTRYIANPGCFATGMLLAVWPLHLNCDKANLSITALTGASGSGIRPKQTTHFPERDGNIRAYKVLEHQHLQEIIQFINPGLSIAMVPVSGPWTRGIWGTVQLNTPAEQSEIARWFENVYSHHSLVRLWPDTLPELQYSVGSPYCDLGWVVQGNHLVIGFAIDNMLRGAASQAIQNMNLLMNLPVETGLVPEALL
ncbi:MAG: N-acetyl-gamma-glutamyl-phosphate reductase [Bacteroidetes bacterium]|nr:N-acetyl-gamma-glutamyl-phosphate reductase [Bacteroidota bacterium]MCY4204388.1 N-acetyl-gamma-glutamyl-phosphate reductase [Bacteroidota bacterium]